MKRRNYERSRITPVSRIKKKKQYTYLGGETISVDIVKERKNNFVYDPAVLGLTKRFIPISEIRSFRIFILFCFSLQKDLRLKFQCNNCTATTKQ